MSLDVPPTGHPIVDNNDGYATDLWLLFFNSVYEGDAGKDWTPEYTSLTEVGAATHAGRYFRITKRLCFFYATIVPGTSVSATAGTTYINNFPLQFNVDGIVFAVTGGLGDGPGHIVASSNRIYIPALSAVTAPVTILGFGLAS